MKDSRHEFHGSTGRQTGAPIDSLLSAKLDPVVRQVRRTRLVAYLAGWWTVLAILGLIVLFVGSGSRGASLWFLLLLTIGISGAVLLARRQCRQAIDPHELAHQIEARHPDLDGLLLTAVQQQPGVDGHLHYLQERVVQQTLQHCRINPWTEPVTWRIAGAHLANVFAMLLFLSVLLGFRGGENGQGIFSGGWLASGVTVTPGDTSIERGERLVLIASFKGSVPADVTLVTTSPSAPPNRIPLVKSLSDPVFGGSIAEVRTDLVYHVEYSGRRTRDFTVKVFEFPRLERADADLTYPDYTSLAPKRIENTRRVSAVEGTRCNLTLQLNKPVVRAQFFPKGVTNPAVSLVVSSNRPVATLAGLTFATNQTYFLQLVDANDRTNKSPEQFVVNVLKNREPELRITSPRGDTRPSALEEVSFEGSVWDDFGLKAYGLAYTEGGGETKFVQLGQTVPANEKRSFKHLLRLEDLGVQPDQLITWFLWADDIGPDGQLRRSLGDMYFAEVRPFDEIFRQGQGGQQSGGGGESAGGGGPRARLAELQKQIINATWKLQRQQSRQPRVPQQTKPTHSRNESKNTSATEPPLARSMRFARLVSFRKVFAQPAPGNPQAEAPLSLARENLSKIAATNKTANVSQFLQDLGVVQDAVKQAIEQAQQQRSGGVGDAALWDSAIGDMEKAKALLSEVAHSPQSLAGALAAEQSAFQALLKLQQREYEVSRNRNRNQGGPGSREQQMQRQLEQLDLTDPENRYENERLAQAPSSAVGASTP